MLDPFPIEHSGPLSVRETKLRFTCHCRHEGCWGSGCPSYGHDDRRHSVTTSLGWPAEARTDCVSPLRLCSVTLWQPTWWASECQQAGPARPRSRRLAQCTGLTPLTEAWANLDSLQPLALLCRKQCTLGENTGNTDRPSDASWSIMTLLKCQIFSSIMNSNINYLSHQFPGSIPSYVRHWKHLRVSLNKQAYILCTSWT